MARIGPDRRRKIKSLQNMKLEKKMIDAGDLKLSIIGHRQSQFRTQAGGTPALPAKKTK
jgi:hypothetical protein